MQWPSKALLRPNCTTVTEKLNSHSDLADRLADRMQGAAAAGADPVLQIEAAVLALEMVRQAWTVLPGSRCAGRSQRQCCFGARDIGLEVIEADGVDVARRSLVKLSMPGVDLFVSIPAIHAGVRCKNSRALQEF
jgi:hypothetical protein